MQQRVDLHAVDRVADAEQGGRAGGGGARSAAGDHADEGELRAAGEQQQTEHAGLGDRQAGGDGERPERDAVEAGRDGDREADPDSGERRRGTGAAGVDTVSS
nr:hypothetical protein GCM10025699_61920 [Microbacterium flavescens]